MKIYAKTDPAKAKSADLYVVGDISDMKWWGDEVTLQDVMDAIADIPSDISELHVRINTYGGSITAGTAMKSEILNLKSKAGFKIITHDIGVSASMGTIMHLIGEERLISEGALYLVHYPIMGASGNSFAHQQAVDELEKLNEDFVAMYMRVFKGTEEELRALMAKETWLTAQEAVDYGFCTGIEGRVQVSASKGGYSFGGTFIPNRMVAMATSKIVVNAKGGEKDMFLNEETQNKVKALVDAGKQAVVSKADDGSFVVAEPVTATLDSTGEFLTAEQVQAKVGKEMTADEVLAALDEGKTLKAKLDAIGDTEGLQARVSEFDKLKAAAIANALKCGVKAKGDRFEQDRWGKTLAGFSYEEVIAQADEWTADAAEALKAGRRVSIPVGSAQASVERAADYQF